MKCSNKLMVLKRLFLMVFLYASLSQMSLASEMQKDTTIIGYIVGNSLIDKGFKWQLVAQSGDTYTFLWSAIHDSKLNPPSLLKKRLLFKVSMHNNGSEKLVKAISSFEKLDLPIVTIADLRKVSSLAESKEIDLNGLFIGTYSDKVWSWKLDADDGNIYVLNWEGAQIYEFTLMALENKRGRIKGYVSTVNNKQIIHSVSILE